VPWFETDGFKLIHNPDKNAVLGCYLKQITPTNRSLLFRINCALHQQAENDRSVFGFLLYHSH
jgi:hypothetical protein